MTDKVFHTFGTLETEIRQQFMEAKVSVREVSRQTGISKSHLVNFKNGERKLSFQNLDTLAGYFGVKYSLKNF